MELRPHPRNLVTWKQYPCSDCGRSFKRNSHLVRHKRLHTGEKPYQCPECGKSFRQSTDVNTHRRIHTGETPYHCNNCGKSFRYRTGLVKHLRCHEEEKPHHCPECGKSLDCSWIPGGQETEQLGGTDKCPRCDRSVECLDLVIQVANSTTEEPYECPDCGKSFSHSFQLIRHRSLQTRFMLPNPNVLCSFGPDVESPLSDPPEAKGRECPGSMCEAHDEASAKECDEHETFPSAKSCRTLFGKLQGIVGQRRDSFKEKTHFMTWPWKQPEGAEGGSPKDEKDDPVMCKELPFHPERRHLCFMCGKTFRYESHLIAHERIHTGEKPFQCSTCEKSFRDRSDLNKHQKVHSREKPFKCLHCGQSFHHQMTFLRHQQLHPSKRPCEQGCLYLALLPSCQPGPEMNPEGKAEPTKALGYSFKAKEPSPPWTLEVSEGTQVCVAPK